MNDFKTFFATSPKGIEPILLSELEKLGATSVKETRAGVKFGGNLETAYRACLWLRTANRVLLPLATFKAQTPDELYAGVQQIDWFEHLEPNGTLAVDFQSSQSAITHTQYGALKVKDAIVDQFRHRFDQRPSVNLTTPHLRINVYLLRDEATVNLDLSGDSLHRRGYRTAGIPAPMKENLAAAVLYRSDWETISKQGGGFIDPMCGSGTLPIEAALMAANSAPGLLRNYFGFLQWKQHQPEIWSRLLVEAEEIEIQGFSQLPPIIGYDSSPKAIKAALECVEKAGLRGLVHFEKQDLGDCRPHPRMKQVPGLVALNPPYGKRIGDVFELKSLYANLGQTLQNYFSGWEATVFTGNVELGKTMGIRSRKKYTLYNGAIECKLLRFSIQPEWFVSNTPAKREPIVAVPADISPDMEMLANRLKKNLKKLKPWLKREQLQCYRIYDKDLPEYAVSIDVYGKYLHVQEYKAPDTINPQVAKARLDNVINALPSVMNVPRGNIFLKTRERQKGTSQYEKLMENQIFHEVEESGNRFLVNFTDYLDTGLFLDHRITRRLVGEMAQGKHFLNLFAYTGSATVYAAKGGARTTTTVDMSKTYISWAKRNLALNGFGYDRHFFHVAECLNWVKNEKRKYDLIFLDPPTFSNSKRMNFIFDIQKDHVELIRDAVSLLEHDGTLIFSNNFKRFKMDSESLSYLKIENITQPTIPDDFCRNPRVHNCWKINRI